MNLKIGTILIAKESFGDYTKDKEYSILENDRDVNYKVSSDKSEVINWLSNKVIEYNFAIKRYTLQDLKDKKIAVRLRSYEEYKRLCDAIGDPLNLEVHYSDGWEYYGIDDSESGIIFMNNKELLGRTILESIDMIDLEVKEEVKETHICKYCGATLSKDVNEEDCYANPNKNHDSTTATLINSLESEIARLKGEVQSWKDSYNGLFRRYEELEKSTPLAVLESTTDLEKRERMAWEIWLQGRYTVEQAIEKVNHFLEESKEVKP